MTTSPSKNEIITIRSRLRRLSVSVAVCAVARISEVGEREIVCAVLARATGLPVVDLA